MAPQLTSSRAVRPRRAAVRRLAVRETCRPSPGFARVTFASTGDGFERDFDYLGFDQWFRLFLPDVSGSLTLPEGDADGWYSRWLAIEAGRRPTVRNYTIRDARREGDRWLIDVDFVVHRSPAGTVDGVAAQWALEATPGEMVGLLDQGRIFDAPGGEIPIVVVADESGLPGVEGILRSLGERPVRCLLEVADAADIRELADRACRHGNAEWIVRGHGDRPGTSAVATLADDTIPASAYVYAVGETALALGVRHRARAAGVADDRIDFCAYWRAGRRAALPGSR